MKRRTSQSQRKKVKGSSKKVKHIFNSYSLHQARAEDMETLQD